MNEVFWTSMENREKLNAERFKLAIDLNTALGQRVIKLEKGTQRLAVLSFFGWVAFLGTVIVSFLLVAE